MYYIYKIENKVNHKKYIGLTNNASRRRQRHFSDLRRKTHDNHFLQREFNEYGEENFDFSIVFSGDVSEREIGQKEQEFIKKYDSFHNGYNQNMGGNFGPSNGGSHLTRQDIFDICSALEFCSRPGAVLAEIFHITTTTVSRIKKKVNHVEDIALYDALSKEERKKIYDDFVVKYDFENKKRHKTVLKTKRNLNQMVVFLILANDEYKILKRAEIMRNLEIKNSNVLYGILRGETYQDYILDYKKLSLEEKEKLVSLLSNE